MKFIHISDLHFGKSLFGYSLIEEKDQIFWVKEFLKLVKEEKVDAVLIAGDIYDRAIAPKEAVELLDYFLNELVKLKVKILMIAGNHDSGTRLEFGSNIFKSKDIYIAGELKKELEVVTLQDEYGEINFYLVPYIFPALVSTIYEDDDIKTYNDAFKKILDEANIDYTKRNVIVSHQTVLNSNEDLMVDGSEIFIGTSGAISVNLYEKFDYAALGHIHVAQKIKYEHVRYSGSILPYHFSQRQDKKVMIIEIKEKGQITYKEESLKLLHNMREIKGYYKDILKEESNNNLRNEYLRVVLKDQAVDTDARIRLNELFEAKNSKLMELALDRTEYKSHYNEINHSRNDKTLEEYFNDFYRLRNNDEFMDEKDMMIVNYISENIKNSNDEDYNNPSKKDIDDIVDYVLKMEDE